MTDARRAGVAALLVLVAGGALLAALPHLSIVRLAGVGLRWWYGALAAPLLAAMVTAVVMLRAPAAVPGLAAWTGPALIAALGARVFAGDALAALLPLAACVAPLLALLTAPFAPAPPRDAVARALAVGALALVLWAHVLAVADVVRALGGERWHGVVLALALAALPALVPARVPLRRAALAGGMVGVVLPVAAVAARPALAPWTAWARLAERPALVFDERSGWATGGGRLLAPMRLTFSEAHRVTAISAATYRVVEREGDHVVTREWRLAGGDSLELRPGDELRVGAGTRVRFEAGKRVPGAAPSGVAWADRVEAWPPAALVGFLGLLVTFAGGAAVVLGGRGTPSPAGRLGAVAAPGVVLAAVLAAVCSGVYAAYAAPDLALGAPSIAPLATLGRARVGPPWDAAFAAAALAGVAALFVAAAEALRRRVGALAGAQAHGEVVWASVAATAAALALVAIDPWRALLVACGLATAVSVAPALAGGAAGARAVGAGVGALVFAALTLGASNGDASPALAAWPALVAAPLAWAATRAARRWSPEVATRRRD